MAPSGAYTRTIGSFSLPCLRDPQLSTPNRRKEEIMPRVKKIYITCDDTGETYVFPMEKNSAPHPQIWAIQVQATTINYDGEYTEFSDFSGHMSTYFVERPLLDKIKFFSAPEAREYLPESEKDKLRETLLKLLEIIGVLPEE
jgi:hypothetical protein